VLAVLGRLEAVNAISSYERKDIEEQVKEYFKENERG
jgi:hypothetical protein